MLCYINFEFNVKHFMHMISPNTCCARLAKEEKKDGNTRRTEKHRIIQPFLKASMGTDKGPVTL